MSDQRFFLLCAAFGAAVFFAATEGAAQAWDFPLRASSNGRYLVDQKDRPFFYQADTAWRLLSNATVEEADEYFAARKAQGFTAIQVILAMTPETKNLEGEPLFLNNSDFSRPNPRYFDHVEAVLRIAEAHSLAIAIAPLWAGCCREGWAGRTIEGGLKPMNINGPEKCAEFGRWLGRRLSKFQNVLWILGGDNDPGETRAEIRALAMGLQEGAPHQMRTYHAASTHSSTDVFPGESWLNLSMIYTYFRGFNKAWNKNQPDVYEAGYAEYNKQPPIPFILGESTYEGEHGEWGSALQVRKQAYWAILSGAAGHAYGSINWRFPRNWREVLRYPGAASLAHLKTLFTLRPWHQLIPDQNNEVAVEGMGPMGQNDFATTASSADRSFAVTYFPSRRKITYNLSRFPPGRVHATWFDPRSGSTIDGGEFPAKGRVSFEPTGDGDWVLVLDAAGTGLPPISTPSVK